MSSAGPRSGPLFIRGPRRYRGFAREPVTLASPSATKLQFPLTSQEPSMKSIARSRLIPLVLALATAFAAASAQADSQDNRSNWRTLDGAAPLVIAHRGASAYFPEETIEA